MTYDTVSSVATLATLRRMKDYRGTLAEYVMAKRGLLGITLTELANRADLSKSELSAIERGKVLLPGAEKRRRLAAALNGFHAELLVHAGELTPEEVIEGANAYDPLRAKIAPLFPENSPAAKIVEILRTLSDEDAALVLGTARMLDRRARGVIDEDDRDIVVTVNSARRFGS